MDILSEIQKLSPFFHNFILHGIRTKPITGNSWNDKNDLINNGFIIEAIKEYNNDRVFIKSRKV